MQKPPRAVQLIAIDENKKIILCEEAAEIIKSFSEQCKHFAVVCVVGKYRTGKSYLVNQVLLQQNKGFNVGSTINACTKGLWMWSELIYFEPGKSKEPIPAILIDTEGIGSVEEEQNHDVKIFLLSILLSSYFIYNSVGNIDDMALQNLGLIVNLTKMLQKADETTQKDLFETFPSFLWILRDFTLRLEDEIGNKITPKEYLENALKPLKGFSEAIENKNKIRRHITQFFQERDCVTLVRPTQDEKDLQHLTEFPFESLRIEFQEQVLALRKKFSYKVQLKQYKGKPITPFSFVEMIKHYVQSINDGNLPVIQSQFYYIIQQKEIQNHIESQLKLYESQLQEYLQDVNPSKGSLDDLHSILVRKIKSYLEANIEPDLLKPRWKGVKQQLNNRITEVQLSIELTQEKQIEELRNNFIDDINHYESEDFWGIVDIGNEAINQFWKLGVCASQFNQFITTIWEAIVQRIQNEFRVIRNLSKLHVEIQSQQQSEIRNLQGQVDQLKYARIQEQMTFDKQIERQSAGQVELIAKNKKLQEDLQELHQIHQKQQASSQQLLKQSESKFQNEVHQLRIQFEQRVLKFNLDMDKFNQLVKQQETIHQSEVEDLKQELDRITLIVDQKNQQLKENHNSSTLKSHREIDQSNVNSARKHRFHEDIILHSAQKAGDRHLQEWKQQKEFIHRQLRQAQTQLLDHQKQNEALINSLKY